MGLSLSRPMCRRPPLPEPREVTAAPMEPRKDARFHQQIPPEPVASPFQTGQICIPRLECE